MNAFSRTALSLATSFVLVPPTFAQHVLKVTNTVQVPTALTGPLYIPVHCSQDGSRLYYRIFDQNRRNNGVTGVSVDGSKVVHYELPATDIYNGTQIGNFAITKTGGVLLFAQKGPDVHAVEFDVTGKVVREVEIPAAGGIAHYSLIGPDEVMAVGAEPSPPGADGSDVSRTAVIKTVNLKEGVVTDRRKLEALSSGGENEQAKADRLKNLTLGAMEPGPDGETYLLGRDDGMRITKMARGVSSLSVLLAPPSKDAIPLQLLVSKDQLGVVFEEDTSLVGTTFIQMVDPRTLQPIRTYTVDGSSAGIVSCISDSAITFIGNRQGHLVIRQASLTP